jgi:hypothetical protein
MLNGIFDLLTNLADYVVAGCVIVVNLVIAGLGAAIQALLDLLPAMPSVPTLPSGAATAVAWINYFLPLDYALSLLSYLLPVALGLRVLFWFLKRYAGIDGGGS